MHNGTKAAHSIEKEDFMKTLKTYMRIGIFFVITTGSLAHFFYDWSGHASIVGYFTPVNESIWEHMKLLFFPMLLYAFVLTVRLRHHAPSIPSALCTGILLGTFLIPLFFYSQTGKHWEKQCWNADWAALRCVPQGTVKYNKNCRQTQKNKGLKTLILCG